MSPHKLAQIAASHRRAQAEEQRLQIKRDDAIRNLATEMAPQEIARIVGLTRERVRQIVAR